MSDLKASLRTFEAASSQSKITDLLRDAVEPGESGNAAKAELAKLLRTFESQDAIYYFLKAMKQADVSVAEALVMMARRY